MSDTPTWSTACPDWERRILAGESLVPFDPLFPDQAVAALDIYRDLRLVDVANSPRIGDVARPWFYDLPQALFGSYDAHSGRRLVRFVFELIAKKNGKSTKAAAIMITALLRNWRESGEYYILAPTREIADNSFAPARDMVRADPTLRTLLHVKENQRTIIHRTTGAFLKVVAADSETISGKKTIGLLVDEVWLLGKRSDAAAMLREARGGLTARPEGFVIYLSTQGDQRPAGVFAALLNEFRAIRDGEIIDPESLPILYEFPQAMVKSGFYRDPKNFYVVNPNLGAGVDLDFLLSQRAKAERDGPGEVINFEAKHLNIQVGEAQGVGSWAGAAFWAARVELGLTLENLIERCDVIVGAADGGGLDDLYGFCALGREKTTGRGLAWFKAWAHRIVLERRKDIAPALLDFERDGDLALFGSADSRAAASDEFDGAPQDVAGVVEIVKQIDDAGKLALMAVDPYGVAVLVEALAEIGVTDDDATDASGKRRLFGVTQGWKLIGAIKTAERRLADGSLVHADQPIAAWCVGNCKTEPRGNAVLITKMVSGSAKIDIAMALIDAVAAMGTNPEPPGGGPSIYNSAAKRPQGFLVV